MIVEVHHFVELVFELRPKKLFGFANVFDHSRKALANVFVGFDFRKPAFASFVKLIDSGFLPTFGLLVVEGNLPTGHKTTIRTGLPQATWRLLNAGVPNAKSSTAQIVDTCGNLETYAVIDKDIADLNGNTAEFRLSEVKAFLEGMSQQVASTIIYGNQHTNPERFTGLAPRYSTVSTANSQTANKLS